jgi:hypothetical protein
MYSLKSWHLKSNTMTEFVLRSQHDFNAHLRQTGNGRGTHSGITCVLTPSDTSTWLVVYDTIAVAEPTHIPKERRVLFVSEPPGFKIYDPTFTNQFGIAVSPFKLDGYQGHWIESQSALPWFYGAPLTNWRFQPRLTLADLQTLSVPQNKQARLSVVCSTKSKLPKHKQRLAFLDALKTAMPDRVDIFGTGFQPIADKADAIDPYRYHLVLENNDIPHFWTEKLADCYLGFALPVFSGCANVTAYFSADALVRLPDLTNHSASIAVIKDLLDRDPWADHLNAIITARTKLIEDYNLFSVIISLIAAHTTAAPWHRLNTPDVLNPPKPVAKSALGSVRNTLRRLASNLK